MADDTARSVEIERFDLERYLVRNRRGGSITIGSGGDQDFTPVELLLAAIGGCSAIDVDLITSRRAEPDHFSVQVNGDKVRDENGNRMQNLTVEFRVTFPDGEASDAARDMLPRAVRQSHDRLCTVSRTVELGTSIEARISEPEPR
jgi:uncharacterized OsmC-like protein